MGVRKIVPSNELYHYGVKGMKWGKRKRTVYKNKDRTRDFQDKSHSKAYGKGFTYNGVYYPETDDSKQADRRIKDHYKNNDGSQTQYFDKTREGTEKAKKAMESSERSQSYKKAASQSYEKAQENIKNNKKLKTKVDRIIDSFKEVGVFGYKTWKK